MDRKTNAFVAAATATAVAITGFGFDQAMAAPSASREVKPALSVQTPTDISAAKRRARRVYRRGADAAAIAAMMGIIGTTVAIATANRRHRYYSPYGYQYQPYPYYGYGYYRPYQPHYYPYYGGYRYW